MDEFLSKVGKQNPNKYGIAEELDAIQFLIGAYHGSIRNMRKGQPQKIVQPTFQHSPSLLQFPTQGKSIESIKEQPSKSVPTLTNLLAMKEKGNRNRIPDTGRLLRNDLKRMTQVRRAFMEDIMTNKLRISLIGKHNKTSKALCDEEISPRKLANIGISLIQDKYSKILPELTASPTIDNSMRSAIKRQQTSRLNVPPTQMFFPEAIRAFPT